MADRFSNGLTPAAFGLLLGIAALLACRYLSSDLNALDAEMRDAVETLAGQLARTASALHSSEILELRSILDKEAVDPFRERRQFRTFVSVGVVALGFVWFVETTYELWFLSAELESAWRFATFRTSLVFGIAALGAYPIWSRFMRRAQGGHFALSATIAFCWTIGEWLYRFKQP